MNKAAVIACSLALVLPFCAAGEGADGMKVFSLSKFFPGTVEGQVEYGMDGTVTGTNGVLVQFKGASLSADRVRVDVRTGEAVADGQVRVESGDMLWVGDHIRYNFKTRQMVSEGFRAGKLPVLIGGAAVVGDNSSTNRVFTATDAFVTTDDEANPPYRVRAQRVEIRPGESVDMWNAVVLVDGLPVMYFPYYHRSLRHRSPHFVFRPGFRSEYGAFVLGTYEWFAEEVADGKVHADYREKRGPGAGPDFNLHLGRWGDLTAKYYYVNDNDPYWSTNNLPVTHRIPRNRQRVSLDWQATPVTNLNLKARVNYQSDPLMLHDFFEGEYTVNPQPATFFEANKNWDDWSLDALAAPEVNDFFNQVERLPDVRLTGFRQPVFNTPFYYDSQSSFGYYERFFANTNAPGNSVFANTNYTGTRIDSYHQITLPWTFFDWLNVAPRVGGRWTYYGDTTGPRDQLFYHETYRTVFNTGARVSFKASRLWADATNSFFQVDGLRHVIEPSADYVYVPNPSRLPGRLPQYDFEQPGLMLSAVDFPDYSSIDSVDAQNVIRFGLRNTLQTKRNGEIEDLVDWNLLLDWRLTPKAGQSTFNDVYSDLKIRPQSWVTLESQTRFNPNDGKFNLAFEQVQFTPGNQWSWGIGYWYLRNGFPAASDSGDNYFMNTVFYRFDDNWGFRATHNFNVLDGRLQEQDYTVYRDMRSWTAALTFRVTDNINGPVGYGVAFAFSFKADPSHHLGDDAVRPDRLLDQY